MIEAITKRDLIRSVSQRWAGQYEKTIGTEPGHRHSVIARRLCALNVEKASEGDVVEIIGNTSWTKIICDACGASVDVAVHVGEPPDYESSTATLCRDCVIEAFHAIEKGCGRMTRALLPGFFIVVGPDERLTIVADTLGIPGALRFGTRAHAEAWLEKHEADADRGRVRRDFGGEAA